MTKMQIGVIRIDFHDSDEESKDYVTCLDPDRLSRCAVIPAAWLIGVILHPLEAGERITPDNFAANTVFVDFMQGVIARRGPQIKDLVAEAQRLGKGTLYVIDQRTRAPHGPGREVLTDDIFGEFEVRDGKIVAGSYRPNPKHYLLSADGFFQLGPQLEHCLLEGLATLPDPDDKPDHSDSQQYIN